jgi:hypothetical protein
MITNTNIGAGPTPTTIFSSSGENAVNLMVFCNTDSTTIGLLTVYVIPSGDSYATKHMIIRKTKLNPLETLTFSTEKLILANGDTIRATATLTDGTNALTGNAVAATVSSIAL